MRRLLTIAVAGTVALALPARAHDLKVLVSRLVASPGDRDTIYVSYGHILPVDQPIDAETLDDYHLHTPSGSVQYLKKDGISLQANEVELHEKGIYQAVAARRPALWADVIDADGTHRHVRGSRSEVTEGNVDHVVRSQSFAKALVLSGDDAAAVPEPLGHAIEIIPADGPASWKPGRDLRFRVLYQGKPLNGAALTATYLGFKPDGAWCYAADSDAKGIAVVRPDRPGTWVLKVNSQRPAPADRRGEYDVEAYTATLVLEVRP